MVDTWNIHRDDDVNTGTSTGTSTGTTWPGAGMGSGSGSSGTGTTTGTTWPGAGMGSGNTTNNTTTTTNNTTNNHHHGMPPGGGAGFTIPTPGPTEEEIKMARFKEAQANYANYGDDLNLWLEDPTAYEDAVDMGFFTAQNEGVLGGVSEYEKQTNLLKKAIANKVGKMNTQGLTDAQFESGLTGLPEYEQLLKLFGGNQNAMLNTLFDPETFAVTDQGFAGTFDPNVNTGFDQTGINTFADTEGDPEKYKAFNLLNDPNADPWSDEYFDALEKIGYNWGPSFDENWYGGDYWDDYLGEYYGPTDRYDKNKRWQQKSLGEILQQGPAGFGDLQTIYGEELSETSGNPFAAVAQYNKQGAFSPAFGETIITEYS